MIIWIVDSDISFSVSLKNKIEKLPFFKEDKIVIFHDLATLETSLKKIKTTPEVEPRFILMEFFINRENTYELYQKLINNYGFNPSHLVFLSSKNFTQFESFFKSQNIPTPLFILKTQIFKKYEDLILSFYTQDEKNISVVPKKNSALPAIKAASKKFNQLVKDIEEALYEADEKSLDKLKQLTIELDKTISDLQFEKSEKLEKVMTKIKNYFELKKVPTSKLRSVVKELIKLSPKIK